MTMTKQRLDRPGLKARLKAGVPLVGTFIKSRAPEQIEALGRSDLDLIVLDAEHCPFDRRDLDSCLLAARSVGLETLVRVPRTSPEHILNALDGGATGVLAPHIRTPGEAEALVQAGHFATGGPVSGIRGFAGATRASGHGARSMAAHLSASGDETVLVAQIEDPEALDHLDAIAATPGLDSVFIGRVDLTVGLGAGSATEDAVESAIDRTLTAARDNAMPVGLFLPGVEALHHWHSRGVGWFLIGADHALVLQGAHGLSDARDRLIAETKAGKEPS